MAHWNMKKADMLSTIERLKEDRFLRKIPKLDDATFRLLREAVAEARTVVEREWKSRVEQSLDGWKKPKQPPPPKHTPYQNFVVFYTHQCGAVRRWIEDWNTDVALEMAESFEDDSPYAFRFCKYRYIVGKQRSVLDSISERYFIGVERDEDDVVLRRDEKRPAGVPTGVSCGGSQ